MNITEDFAKKDASHTKLNEVQNLTLLKIKDSDKDRISSAAGRMRQLILSGDAFEVECPVTHRFTDGCYLREIFMPKGAAVIGKVHATTHFNIILKGSVTVLTSDGVTDLKAPHTFISEAGVQKVVMVHEDCVWQTIHVTDETCLEKIEKKVITDCGNDFKIGSIIEKYIEDKL